MKKAKEIVRTKFEHSYKYRDDLGDWPEPEDETDPTRKVRTVYA